MSGKRRFALIRALDVADRAAADGAFGLTIQQHSSMFTYV